MTDQDTESGNDKLGIRGDLAIKKLMEHAPILSNMICGCVPEFKTMDPAMVPQYFIGPKSNTPQRVNGELAGDTGSPLRLDLLYDIRLPNKEEDVSLRFHIEAQGKYHTSYPITNRATGYESALIFSQLYPDRGSVNHQIEQETNQKHSCSTEDKYKTLRKVVSVWIFLNPPKNRENSIIQYSTTGRYVDRFESGEPIPKKDQITTYFIFLGEPKQPGLDETYESEDSVSRMIGMLNTLFSAGLKLKERKTLLLEKYLISWDEIIESGVKEMSTIIEDLRQSYIDNAIEETSINLTVSHVLKLVKTYGVTVEEAIEILDVPEDIRHSVTYLSKDKLNQ
ncbi:hypothetical protein AR505_0623 [methanogenic archaeon ISO4-H5]|jgi:hypothetical protein|nr:hypothetical protein AR505_0623 [methanogenic archaeon ISO4-H5]